MQITFHCLFEQSGTFKNVFKSYGHEAYDYDILNDYGQTDFQIDLFEQIQDAYQIITDYPSYLQKTQDECKNTGNTIACMYAHNIFFKMKPETDFIIAFFPCTYFSEQNELVFRHEGINKKYEHLKWTREAIERTLKRVKDREDMFSLFIKFCYICQELKVPTIIENPSSPIKRSYLELYSPYRPSWRENDRTKFGDKFIKPTNFFAINFEMKENFQMFDLEPNRKAIKSKTGEQTAKLASKGIKVIQNQRERSEITPRYADNFYKRFIKAELNKRIAI